jgi:hypothetical protein
VRSSAIGGATYTEPQSGAVKPGNEWGAPVVGRRPRGHRGGEIEAFVAFVQTG